MKQSYIIIGLLLLGSITSWGQTRNAFLHAAEDAVEEENYYAALDYYLEALDFDTSDVAINFKVAEAARMFESYELAEKHYTYVLEKDTDAKYPLANYHLAHMQQMQGNYEMAKRNYEMYLSQFDGEDQFHTDKASKEISSIEWSKEMIENPEPSFTVMSMEEINTPYSEVGAILDGENVVYSSVRFLPKDRKKYSNRHISKVLSNAQTTETGEFAEDFNKDNLHTAHVTYNMNKSKMFYTICEYLKGGEDIRCDIYCRPILGDGTYGEEKKLSNGVNIDSFTTTQPNIGFDKTSGQEILYFVSDRPGGKGGLDIWASNITGVETFAQPVNVSALNTPSDEMSPFYHNMSQVMYYSTNGDMTLGGYDVYRSVNNAGSFQKGENVGAPINSSYNDLYYSVSDDGNTALMSSNRIGSQYIDARNKSCCYDIYKVDISKVEINLNALTYDAKSLDSLEGVRVDLVCVESGEILNSITNDLTNDHIFSLDRGKEYLLISSKKGYYTDTLPFNTNTIFKSEDLIRKVYLERSTLELQVFTFDDISREALPGTTVRLIDLTDNTIQEITLTNENANDFLFDVIPGHSYRIIASRDRYYEDSVEFVAKDDDGSGVIRKDMYLVRRDLNIYLPLALYFDNDIPERRRGVLASGAKRGSQAEGRAERLTTDLKYSETFDDYVIRKIDFKKQYSRKLRGDQKDLAEQRIESFFEEDVKGGYDRFNRFLDYILGQLKDGNSFDISVRGYASPRADTKYNLALSQRRVVSAQNELRDYRDGALIEYIDNGMLKITELSYGESLAPDNVSDVLYDRINSVYSPEASRERRVEIVEIKQASF